MNYSLKLVEKLSTIALFGLQLGACQDANMAAPAATTTPVVQAAQTAPAAAVFDWFSYEGRDPEFATPLTAGTYQNPVLAGYFPDPTITKRTNADGSEDFYMAVSSFVMTPGLPILHSKDLVNWQLIGHALERDSQFDMRGQQISQGIYAPTIRYHDGVFYLINTTVATQTTKGGNFIMTATDPAGPWSDPIWLPEVPGIDPDIFFDDDGKIYITHNAEAPGEALYEGHRAIWLWQYDPLQKAVLKDSKKLLVNGGVDLAKKPIWIEAPHLIKHNGWYYLICAEGGTADQHSEVVFRSKSLNEPFVPWEKNPILTQRDLAPNRPDPVTTAGHADFVQLADGTWWAVFLATRAYDEQYFNAGRETFLLPVSWQDGWPMILPQGEVLPMRPALPASLVGKMPKVADPLTGNFSWRDDFTTSILSKHWYQLREHSKAKLQLDGQQLQLNPAASLATLEQPAFVARRQQHLHYDASTALTVPAAGSSAGLVAFQNEQYHYYLGVRRNADGAEIFLEQAAGAAPQQLVSLVVKAAHHQIQLKISGDKGEVRFFYALGGAGGEHAKWQLLSSPQGAVFDGKILSTQVAKGFVGTMLGMHSRLEPALLNTVAVADKP
ncbi:glycoside hydrolase family 43 protein [Rheinheimera texasensis]|uniref:glycoside hydrolase family 43 protein n=1 Tax=Rheinheimera texasensis TaxID=306205 RepID=UPI0032B2A767